MGVSRLNEISADAHMDLHKKMRTKADDLPDVKVLGLTWSTLSDFLAVEIPEFGYPTTKSSLLSAVSKCFDPLGLLTPWLVRGKSMFRKTWKMMPSGGWGGESSRGSSAGGERLVDRCGRTVCVVPSLVPPV